MIHPELRRDRLFHISTLATIPGPAAMRSWSPAFRLALCARVTGSMQCIALQWCQGIVYQISRITAHADPVVLRIMDVVVQEGDAEPACGNVAAVAQSAPCRATNLHLHPLCLTWRQFACYVRLHCICRLLASCLLGSVVSGANPVVRVEVRDLIYHVTMSVRCCVSKKGPSPPVHLEPGRDSP